LAEPVAPVKRRAYGGAMSESLIPAVSVALRRADTLLLVQRANEPAKGQWAFPGGRVEPGEEPVDAMRRELLEETGMRSGPARLLVVMELGRFRLTVFSGDALDGAPAAGDDAAAAGFFSLAEIQTMDATDSTKHCARLVLAAD
jgi:ADP-ribose pyrophosphatase YjhB (NUDIX family)